MLERLAKRIRAQREKRGLKQQDIANALGISPQAVSKWERGENAPDIAVLGPLARLLGVSVDWLLAVHEQERPVFRATVFVSTVRGAYQRSLDVTPQDFALWANGLFYQLTELTLRHDGVPVKYMGDKYLCFFAGERQCERACETARQARRLIADELRIGLSCGDVYLGSVGHPDYARPDIMGKAVNLAFLTADWAEAHAADGLAVTREVRDALEATVAFGRGELVNFLGLDHPVEVCELMV